MSLEAHAFVQGAHDFLLEGNWHQGPLPCNENEAAFSEREIHGVGAGCNLS